MYTFVSPCHLTSQLAATGKFSCRVTLHGKPALLIAYTLLSFLLFSFFSRLCLTKRKMRQIVERLQLNSIIGKSIHLSSHTRTHRRERKRNLFGRRRKGVIWRKLCSLSSWTRHGNICSSSFRVKFILFFFLFSLLIFKFFFHPHLIFSLQRR